MHDERAGQLPGPTGQGRLRPRRSNFNLGNNHQQQQSSHQTHTSLPHGGRNAFDHKLSFRHDLVFVFDTFDLERAFLYGGLVDSGNLGQILNDRVRVLGFQLDK